MNKKLVAVLVALAVIAGGFFLVKSFDTETVVRTGCVVTNSYTSYRAPKQGGSRHYIETENCGHFSATRTAKENVEEGKTYDLTLKGLFTWDKSVSSVQER